VRVKQNGGEAVVAIERDDRLADGVVRLAAAHPATAGLGGMFDPITAVEKAS
jgi:NADH-quinone oxidoreductase subunit G